MAEFLHTFRGGKMNKDQDERLIPEGQYRDALNLEISTSEGSDTGALQNIKGNTEVLNKTYNPSLNSIAGGDNFNPFGPTGTIVNCKFSIASFDSPY